MSYDDDDEPPSVCLVREPSVVSNRLWRRVGQARGALLPFRQNPAARNGKSRREICMIVPSTWQKKRGWTSRRSSRFS
jgi:hypothetical protein